MIKDENYINVQGFMVTKLGLSGNDLLVYAIIYGFSQDGESVFKGTRKYLAEWCNATERGIQKNLNNLIERNLIEQVTHTPNNHLVCYKVTNWIASEQSSLANQGSSEQSSPPVVNKVHEDSEQSSLAYNKLEDNIVNKLDIVSTYVDTSPTEGGSLSDTETTSCVLENSHSENKSIRTPQKILTKEKPKKKNLWERCSDEVNTRYTNTRLHALLIEYLEYRIHSRQHPMGYAGWVGLLNKLDTLGKTDEEKCKIIEQSIKMKWDTFTELKTWGRKNDRSVFGETDNMRAGAPVGSFKPGVIF